MLPVYVADLKQCRICLDEVEVQYLIRPCLCKGTSEYVHISCLEIWRQSTINANNLYRCDVCHYRYKFSRMKYVKLLQNIWIARMLHVIIMLFTIYTIQLFFKCIGFLWTGEFHIGSWLEFFFGQFVLLIIRILDCIGYADFIWKLINRKIIYVLQKLGTRILDIKEE